MIYKNVELHNVEEPVEQPDGSVLLQRVPESVRQHLNDWAKERMRNPAGCEVRLMFDGPACDVTLSSVPHDTGTTSQAVVFFGEHQCAGQHTVTPEPRTIRIEKPERLFRVDAGCVGPAAFSRDVCRIRFGGGQVCFHRAEGENVRPPAKEDVPGKRLLAYGTSITQGAAASAPHLTYAAITARVLGMDLVNLGSGGSCQCEPEKADYIAARTDWDLAVLALSVNMRGFAVDEYYERVAYTVRTVAGAGRPVVCITLWPYYSDFTENGTPMEVIAGTAAEYRQKLRDAVAACPHGNILLLEGPELFKDVTGLTGDLIHPGDLGMMEMAMNLTTAIKGASGFEI